MKISQTSENLENPKHQDLNSDNNYESDQDAALFSKFPVLKPTRSGFTPSLDLGIIVDPGIDLLGQFYEHHKEDSKSNRKLLFESFFSLFCVWA